MLSSVFGLLLFSKLWFHSLRMSVPLSPLIFNKNPFLFQKNLPSLVCRSFDPTTLPSITSWTWKAPLQSVCMRQPTLKLGDSLVSLPSSKAGGLDYSLWGNLYVKQNETKQNCLVPAVYQSVCACVQEKEEVNLHRQPYYKHPPIRNPTVVILFPLLPTAFPRTVIYLIFTNMNNAARGMCWTAVMLGVWHTYPQSQKRPILWLIWTASTPQI